MTFLCGTTSGLHFSHLSLLYLFHNEINGQAEPPYCPPPPAAPVCTAEQHLVPQKETAFGPTKGNHICLLGNLNASNCLLQPSHRATFCTRGRSQTSARPDVVEPSRLTLCQADGDASCHYSRMLRGLLSTCRCVSEEQLNETALFLPEDGVTSSP